MLNYGFLHLYVFFFCLFVCDYSLTYGKVLFLICYSLNEKFIIDDLIMDVEFELINDDYTLFLRWELGLVCGLMWGNWALEKVFCMDLWECFLLHIKRCVEELVARSKWLGFVVSRMCLLHCRLNWWEQVSYFFSFFINCSWRNMLKA